MSKGKAEVPASKQEQLKAITLKKKELAAEQKALRDDLNESKAERAVARKTQATARKTVREQKSALRNLAAEIYPVFSKGDSEAIGKLADSLMEAATSLAGSVREFGESMDSDDGL